MVGAISTIKARAPVTGGNFGVWGGMFSTFDCAVKGWRQKEDAWNAIISGFMTGGCLAARSEFPLVFAPFFISDFHASDARWPKISTRIRNCVWYPFGCVRGRRCPSLPCVQRGHTTTASAMYVASFCFIMFPDRFHLYDFVFHLPVIPSSRFQFALVSCPQYQILFSHNPQDTSSIPAPQSILQ